MKDGRWSTLNPNIDYLYYGRPCKYGHSQADGKNVRTTGGSCFACKCGKPNNTIVDSIEGCHNHISELPSYIPEDKKEESRLRHIEAVKRWNKKNYDKVRGYVKKYYNKQKELKNDSE